MSFPRHRGDANTTPLPTSGYSWTGNRFTGTATSGTDSYSFEACEMGTTRSMDDYVTASFREKVARGLVINSPMTKVETAYTVSIGARSYRVKKTGSQTHDMNKSWPRSPICISVRGGPLGHIGSNIDVGSLVKVAGTQAAANIDDAVFEGAIFAAELSETISFLRHPLKNWNDFLKAVRRTKRKGRFARALTVQEFIASNWLAYRYAVRPLVGDIQDAIAAVKSIQERAPERRTARGTSSSSGSMSSTTVLGASGGQEFTYSSTTHTNIKVRAGVLYEHTRDPDTFGVAYHDLPVAIWEAVRFSFVIDWFANIGPWIEAITPKVGVNVLTSWTTVETSQRTEGFSYWSKGGTEGVYGPRIIGANASTSENLSTESKTRSPGITVGLTFKPQPFSGSLGTKRILDSLALASALFLSR
nr:MAG: maturation protein [Leviviridae sp.]